MNSDISELAAHLLRCKELEDSAKEARIKAEFNLVAALGFDKLEGSKTYKVDGGDGPTWGVREKFKVTAKASMNYTLDREAWNQVEHLVPDGLRPVRTKLEADPTGCKWLRDNDPETWAICARAITAKPAKVSVSVERVSESEAA